MLLTTPSLVALLSTLQLISARGKPIDIFNQGGKGDILQLRVSDKQGDKRMYNALRKNSNLKWKGDGETYVIPYIITGEYAEAMKRIHQNTCIRFKRRTTERDFIDIQNQRGEGCYTSVGRVGGRETLMLESNSYATCMETEIVLHELMHVIGLWHEHMRYDRDAYINVIWKNIPRQYWSQFEKISSRESTTYDIPYDYKSVMHYGKNAFAYPGKISMETKNPKFQNIIGKAKDASPSDYRKICAIYGCKSCMSGKVDPEEDNTTDEDYEDNGVPDVSIVKPKDCVDVMGFCGVMVSMGMVDCNTYGKRVCCATCSKHTGKPTNPFGGLTSTNPFGGLTSTNPFDGFPSTDTFGGFPSFFRRW
ncbi:Metalloendopeptidase [Trichostrongylus colubriformis]|uniref:Metalloendopeptidase n=1 Tax=Trichostrongylus colubriformis TaxID=6319 RepID=A0AAN8FQJ1_TRICO